MPSTEHFPPPSRPEQRYDAVVARGERLRRRDRTRRALATTGVAAVAVLAIGIGVLAARGGGTMALNLYHRLPAGPANAADAGPTADLLRARSAGWAIHVVRDMADLLAFARDFSRQHYAGPAVGVRE